MSYEDKYVYLRKPWLARNDGERQLIDDRGLAGKTGLCVGDGTTYLRVLFGQKDVYDLTYKMFAPIGRLMINHMFWVTITYVVLNFLAFYIGLRRTDFFWVNLGIFLAIPIITWFSTAGKAIRQRAEIEKQRLKNLTRQD
jgi:hypothetical protein